MENCFYNKIIRSQLKKECDNIDVLKMHVVKDYELTKNKNSLCAYEKGKTVLLLVGTMMPANLPFFYFGSSRMYGSIIDVYKSNNFKFENKRKDIMKLYQDNKNNCDCVKTQIEEFKHELSKIGVAFVDVFCEILHKRGSSKDNDIKWYTIDHNFFDQIKKDDKLKIVAMSKLSDAILREKIGIEQFEYIQYFNGCNDSYKNLLRKYLGN